MQDIFSATYYKIRSQKKFEFKVKSVDERMKFCESKKICVKCLRWSHRPETCKFEGKCFVCGERHNTMLHGAKTNNTAQVAEDLLDMSVEPEAPNLS